MRVILATLHSKYIHGSLALPYLAAYSRAVECEIDIQEFTIHEPKEAILAQLLLHVPDIVAFSVYLWNRRETLELVDALSAAAPALRIVLGGPEITFEGHELFLHHPGLDAVVRGEGEIPLKGLLEAWSMGEKPTGVARLAWRDGDLVHEGPDAPPLGSLDDISSPFAAGLVDLERGFAYMETSRGCPYRCSFCMSALDDKVRSFSMERIRSDLRLLMDAGVPKIKLVDRTFNYDPARAREIFVFILEHNRTSHFHFEIGAHLLDDATLDLLAGAPEGMFQFEIGVQSTLDETLDAVDRRVDLERLEHNVRVLREQDRIHLHLDLIAGLPGENYPQLLDSIDRVIALKPHHLQLEPVKILPGSPIRASAAELGIHFDPNPPYTVLSTPELSFPDLVRTRNLSRLLDQSWNHGRMQPFLEALAEECGSFSRGLDRLCSRLEKAGAFKHPLSQRGLFETIWDALEEEFSEAVAAPLIEHLARDYALSERVSPSAPPGFFDTDLSTEEESRARTRLAEELDAIRGKGIKLQYFICSFKHLSPAGRSVRMFLYLTRSGKGMSVREIIL